MREILEKRDEANNMVFMTTEFDLLKVLDRDVKVSAVTILSFSSVS